MASGKEHDRSIVKTTPVVFALGCFICHKLGFDFLLAAIATASHLFAGLYLSPDMDCKSNPYYRWGVLRWFWFPYVWSTPHRGMSHVPFVGISARLVYLLIVPVSFCVSSFGFDVVLEWARSHFRELCAVFLGAELSVWVHLLLDFWHSKLKTFKRLSK